MIEFLVDQNFNENMPGVFLVSGEMPVGRAIDELLIAIQCLSAEECKDLVWCFPL